VPYLAAGVVIVFVLTALNLLLIFGVVRRLREHTELLSARPGLGPSDLMVRLGESPGEFAATTTDGERISRDSLVGGQLVGFFSPGCEACKERAPLFAEHAAAGDRHQALVVVVGAPDEVGELVARFEPLARVVVESSTGEASVAGAFKVKGFPAICTLDAGGVVTAAGFDVVAPGKPVPVP
jgi:thiol-disulfide isomerase/thioredoxin